MTGTLESSTRKLGVLQSQAYIRTEKLFFFFFLKKITKNVRLRVVRCGSGGSRWVYVSFLRVENLEILKLRSFEKI
jgi:hypothetical protein